MTIQIDFAGNPIKSRCDVSPRNGVPTVGTRPVYIMEYGGSIQPLTSMLSPEVPYRDTAYRIFRQNVITHKPVEPRNSLLMPASF